MIQIQISDENWENLNKMKKPGQTFDEVLTQLILGVKSKEEK